VRDMDVKDSTFDARLDDLWISLERHMDEEVGCMEKLKRVLSEEDSFVLSRTLGHLKTHSYRHLGDHRCWTHDCVLRKQTELKGRLRVSFRDTVFLVCITICLK
jgi:hypothetical protein